MASQSPSPASTSPTPPPCGSASSSTSGSTTPPALVETLRDGIRTAAEAGARIVFLPELTLSRYPADTLPEGTPVGHRRGRSRPARP